MSERDRFERSAWQIIRHSPPPSPISPTSVWIESGVLRTFGDREVAAAGSRFALAEPGTRGPAT
jgi:hypothetical protein